jgi:hypothetical protein
MLKLSQVADWSRAMEKNGLLNEMHGHTQPHCFRIFANAEGVVGVWVKEYASTPEEWQGSDGSNKKAFVLVKPDKIPRNLSNFFGDCHAQPKSFSPEDIKQLEAGLDKCHSRMRNIDPSNEQYNRCKESIARLHAANPIAFHWFNEGRYRKEARILQEAGGEYLDDMDDSEEEAPLPKARSVLTSRKRRHKEIDEDDKPQERYPIVGNMVAVKADGSDAHRFWLGQVLSLKKDKDGKPDSLEVHWYQARKEFGKYVPLFVTSGRNRKKHTNEIEYESALYSFDCLNGEGKVPQVHEDQIAYIVASQ